MKYTVYKIINKLDEKIYIGCHKTEDINDRYMGSGLHLKRAQEKHGIENFTKEILEVFDTPEMMFQYESILVDEAFVKSSETYNLKVGGFGGWDFINDLDRTWNTNIEFAAEKGREKQQWLKQNDDVWNKNKSYAVSEAMIKFYKNGGKTFKDKKHSDESKKMIGKKNSKNQKGEKNSQFGTIWIHNLDLKESKRIPKGEVPEGWLRGRKMKF